MVSPNLDSNNLTFEHLHRSLDRKEQWEPTVHALGVGWRVGRVEDVLIQFCCKVSCKAVDFTLNFLNSELKSSMALQRTGFILLQGLQFFVVWERKMSECEHFLCLFSARESAIVDFDYVGQLEWEHLLRQRHSSADSLLSINHHFVPNHLAAQRNHLVGVTPWQIDTALFQEFLGRDQTFW